MPLTAYPIARDAHEALSLLRQGKAKCAAREKEAEALAGARVAFVTQSLGPVYEDEAVARHGYGGLAEGQVCKLTCRMKDAPRRRAKATQPVFHDGERWPKARAPLETVWQLSLSYWKILEDARSTPSTPGDARTLRKRAKTGDLTPDEMRSLMESPLTAPRPQKALDFGLFDFIPPDNPGIVIADE